MSEEGLGTEEEAVEEEEKFTLTPKGIIVACMMHKMYLDGLSIEEIAARAGYPVEALVWLYAFANEAGVIDDFEENLKREQGI